MQPKPASPVPVGVWSPKVAETLGKNAKPALTAKEALSAKAARAAQQTVAKPKGAPGEARSEAGSGASVIDAALVNAGWDDAVAAAKSVGDAQAQALIDAWVAASNGAAVASVADANDAPGAARKAAKRALNVLKSRGVNVPSKPHVVRFTDREESLEATYIPPDSSGACSYSVTSRDTSGRYHLAEVIVREPFGILHAGSGWASFSQVREGRQRALESLGVAPVTVPVEWARYRIAEARQMNAASRQVVPLNFERCRELVEPAPEAAPAHPVADLEAEVTSELGWSLAPASATLHQEPEFQAWIPDRASLNELLEGVGKRLGPDGLRNQEAVNAALSEEVALATDRFFSPEVRSVIARRMRDAAISVRSRKGDARAKDVLGVARILPEAGLITSPPREIPFLLAFFQKGIAALAQQGAGSLRIPVPQGAAAAAESAPEAESSSEG